MGHGEQPADGQGRRAAGNGEGYPEDARRRIDAAGEIRAAIGEHRAATARLVAVARYLAGETAGIDPPGWMPVRDPATGQRLYDYHPSGQMRFGYRWHGAHREVILPLPSVA